MTDFQMIYEKAMAAGKAAAEAKVPTPMHVVQTAGFGGPIVKRYEPVMDGVCGFAWVKVKPATQPFAKWLKATGKVRGAAYGGGYDLWISDYNQSMERKEAHARAMAKALNEAGIKAYADSRMD